MLRTLHKGRFLELVAEGHWEFARRPGDIPPVGILAVTPEQKIILISQYRIPVGRTCIEIPAGLVGDTSADESWKSAAIRELREETGFTARDMEFLAKAPTSPGLTSECIILARAIGVSRAGEPEPDGDEKIEVHEVPVREAGAFLRSQEAMGKLVDTKVHMALYFLQNH
jgi:ADP-ribose pyrophosphatase